MDKLAEQEGCVGGPSRSFGMELCGKEGLGPVFHPFVGIIVHIEEQGFPFVWEGFIVYRKSVIL